MTLPLVLGVAALVVYLVLKLLNRTTTPKIPGLPAVPGLPFVGSLFDIGECHARKAQEWAQTYGPVFQVRLGNRVCTTCPDPSQTHTPY
jgi:phenylacetate 2-hydroxylase